MARMIHKRWLTTLLGAVSFVFVVFRFDAIEKLYSFLFNSKSVLVERAPLYELAHQHISMVLISGTLAIAIGITLGVMTRFLFFKEFKELFQQLAALSETFPSIAILALSVPLVGYGFLPILLALTLYGILPVLRNTIEGIDAVPTEITDAAKGLGMSDLQKLIRVELILASDVIIAGIRTSMIIIISAATLGATIGAGGFGTLIINGIRSYDTLMILKGAIPVSLLALTADSFFVNVQKAMRHEG